MPERTRALLLLVPFAQLGGREGELSAGMHPRSVANLQMARRRPWLMKLILGGVRLVQAVPHGNALYRFAGFSPADLAALEAHPARAEQLKRASREGTRPGIAGAFRDMEVSHRLPCTRCAGRRAAHSAAMLLCGSLLGAALRGAGSLTPEPHAVFKPLPLQVMTAVPRHDLGRVACKAVVWGGGQDRTTPPEMARFYRGAIPGCAAREVPDRGHFLVFEHGHEVLKSVL